VASQMFLLAVAEARALCFLVVESAAQEVPHPNVRCALPLSGYLRASQRSL
jgi:hypothetical protein